MENTKKAYIVMNEGYSCIEMVTLSYEKACSAILEKLVKEDSLYTSSDQIEIDEFENLTGKELCQALQNKYGKDIIEDILYENRELYSIDTERLVED